MKRTVVYTFESDDAPWQTRIEEAFNRVINFCPELTTVQRKERTKELASFNRIVNGMFDRADIENLQKLAVTVSERAKERYATAENQVAASLVKASVLQAVDNLSNTLAEFISWFNASL